VVWHASHEGLFPLFTTEIISVVKIYYSSATMRRYTPGERLWHNPETADCHASTYSA
jgi:hypothetical protein